MNDLTIRDAIEADIPALSRLHVTTWNDTHRRRLAAVCPTD
jgi:hypothetical protein